MKRASLPKQMTAIEIRNGMLVPTQRPLPKPGAGEILVCVEAAGVNRPDILQRKGLYPPPAGTADIPGLEIAGTVAALGRGTAGFRPGQKVAALVAGGGYAQYCTVPALQALPVPKGLDTTGAAALPETFFTVWANLVMIGNLQKGESVLIHGGASGIGTAAIQIARQLGAKVFVTAGTDDKCRRCVKLGARAAVNYRTQDFVEEILCLTKGRGVDVVLDMVGGDYVARNLKILAPAGRHVSIAVQRGRTAEIDLLQVMSKRLVLTGSTLRPRSVAEKGEIAKALKKHVWPQVGKGRIRPVIDRVFPLQDAQAAHDYLESGAHFGKIVLIT